MPAPLTQVGWAIEDTFGVFKAPTYLTPTLAMNLRKEIDPILDDAIRGVAAKDFASYAGLSLVSGELSGFAYPTTLNDLIRGMLGTRDVLATGYQYELADTVPSFSFQIYDDKIESGNKVQRFTGCFLRELTITMSGGTLLTWSASFVGQAFAWGSVGFTVGKWAASVPAWDSAINIKWNTKRRWGPHGGHTGGGMAQPSLDTPFSNWTAVAKMGSPAAYGRVTDAQITLRREPILHYGDIADEPSAIYAGLLEVTGQITVRQDDSDRARYDDKTQELFEITWTQGDYTLYFRGTDVDYGDAPLSIDRSGVAQELTYSIRALYNSTDSGPCIFETEEFSWWNAEGITGCVGAWKAVNVDTYAETLADLSGNSNDLTDTGHAPSWSSDRGWYFDGYSEYLETPVIVTDADWSVLVKFDTELAFPSGYIIGAQSGFASRTFGLRPTFSTYYYWYNGGFKFIDAFAQSSGVAAMRGTYCYHDGVYKIQITTAWGGAGTLPLYIGARNDYVAGADNFTNFDIQAVAVYNKVLTEAELQAVTEAMQDL